MEALVDILTLLNNNINNNKIFIWEALGRYIDSVKELRSPNWESLFVF